MAESRVRPLLEYHFPEEEIAVQGKDGRRQIFTREKYKQVFGSSLVHGIFYDARHEKEVHEIKTHLSASSWRYEVQNKRLKSFLDNPKNYFSICYVNEVCGYVLVADKDIPKGEIVGIYSSLLRLEPMESKEVESPQEEIYDMSLHPLSNVELNSISYDLTLRAKSYGDQTRFAPHLLDLEKLSELNQSGQLGLIKKDNVLTENINYLLTNYQGVLVRYFITNKMIKKGHIAGINYGEGYWESRGRPCLFVRVDNKEGQFRIASFNPKLNQYVLNKELVLTQSKQSVWMETKAAHSSWIVRPPVMKPLLPQPQPQPQPQLHFFTSNRSAVVQRSPRPVLRQASALPEESRRKPVASNMQTSVPHWQLPTRTSLSRSRLGFYARKPYTVTRKLDHSASLSKTKTNRAFKVKV